MPQGDNSNGTVKQIVVTVVIVVWWWVFVAMILSLGGGK